MCHIAADVGVQPEAIARLDEAEGSPLRKDQPPRPSGGVADRYRRGGSSSADHRARRAGYPHFAPQSATAVPIIMGGGLRPSG